MRRHDARSHSSLGEASMLHSPRAVFGSAARDNAWHSNHILEAMRPLLGLPRASGWDDGADGRVRRFVDGAPCCDHRGRVIDPTTLGGPALAGWVPENGRDCGQTETLHFMALVVHAEYSLCSGSWSASPNETSQHFAAMSCRLRSTHAGCRGPLVLLRCRRLAGRRGGFDMIVCKEVTKRHPQYVAQKTQHISQKMGAARIEGEEMTGTFGSHRRDHLGTS